MHVSILKALRSPAAMKLTGAKDLNKHFLQTKYTNGTKKHMKSYSTTLVIQIKSTMSHHLTTKQKITSVGEEVEELEPCAPSVGMQNSTGAVENSMEAPPEITNIRII